MKNILLFSFVVMMTFFIANNSTAQNTFPSNGAVGIGTTFPNASSVLDVTSTAKGVLVPRMTKTQRDAIATPATGLLIYQTNSTPGFYYYSGSKWTAVSPKGVNKSLSNLTEPTAINAELLPDSDDVRNFGSPNNSWKDAYFDGSVYLGGARFLSYSLGTGKRNTAVGSIVLNANTTGSNNTGVGWNALYSNITGYNNVAIGTDALKNNTASYNVVAIGDSALFNQSSTAYDIYPNTAVGSGAMFANTTGYANVAVGAVSLYNNTSGYSNSAFGLNTLLNNTTGKENTAIGEASLKFNTTGNYNNAIGHAALYYNTEGSGNNAIGNNSLSNNTTGSDNAANGYYALYNNTTGDKNTAIGITALKNNITGSENVAIGDSAAYDQNTNVYSNTAIGSRALRYNVTGTANTACGSYALYNNTATNNSAFGNASLTDNTTGVSNSGFGNGALYYNTTGAYNVAFGESAGMNIIDGSNNTFVGYNANCGSGGHIVNGMALGYQATVTSGNHVVIGNSSVTSIGGFVNWSNLSDGRVKKNIKQNVPGLEFINKLQPITYNLDLDAADKIIALPERKDKDGRLNEEVGQGKTIQPSQFELDSRQAKEQIVYTGFVAQDVEKAAKELNYDFSGVDKPDNANTLYGLRYSDFVVPLVKAVQELSVRNDSLKNDNTALHQQVNDLISRMNSVEQSLSQCCTSFQSPAKSSTQDSGNSIDGARLEQNAPNPFSQNTTIQFYIPSSVSDAMIVVSDLSGKIIQQFSHLPVGNGTVMLAAGALTSGTYQYSLFVNGKVIDTKQMVLTK